MRFRYDSHTHVQRIHPGMRHTAKSVMSERDNPNHGTRPVDQQRTQEHNNPSPNNASGGNDRPAQTAQPLVLDQTSLKQ